MFGLGMSEIIVLGLLALIIIGPKELPQMARTIGRFINELKRSTNALGDEIKQQVRVDFDNHQGRAPTPTDAPSEPEQMEFADQPQDPDDKEEHKQS